MSGRTPLRGWLTAEAISLTGTRISTIAIPWFVLTTTGSATRTGVVAFAELAPLVLLKALGGPVIDRIGPRRVALVADAASVVAVGLVPVLHLAGLLGFPLLLGLVAIAGALRGPGDAAKAALVPDLVEHAGVSLERATGLSSAVERTASMAGAAVAAGLVAAVGATRALLLDAVSFGLSGMLLLLTTRGLGLPRTPSGSTYTTELREGYDFLRHDSVLVAIAGMVAVTNLIDQAYSVVLLPVWAHESGNGIAAIGILGVAWGAASAVGSMVAATYAERLPRLRTYVIAFLVTGLPRYAALALGAPLGLVVLVAVAGGFASGFLNPVLGAVIFERIPAHLVGRVSSLNTALCWGLMPLGGVLAGPLVSGVGLATTLWVLGIAYLVTTMVPTVQPSWRQIERPAPARERETVSP